MKKIIYSIALVAFTFMSCTNDLEDQINDLEKALENSYLIADAVSLTHEYSYDENNPINETFELAISSPDNQILTQYSGNENIYYINIENSLSLDGNNYFGLYFYYDVDHEEVLTNNDGYNARMYYSYTNLYDDNISISAYDSQNSSQYQDLNIIVNSINVETGKISFEVEFDYTKDYNYSEYNTDGKLKAAFDGTLNFIKNKPNNTNNNLDGIK